MNEKLWQLVRDLNAVNSNQRCEVVEIIQRATALCDDDIEKLRRQLLRAASILRKRHNWNVTVQVNGDLY